MNLSRKLFYKLKNFVILRDNTRISLIMNNKVLKSNEHMADLANAERCIVLSPTAKHYTAPVIEVVEIELTQNILQTSGNAPADFGGYDW